MRPSARRSSSGRRALALVAVTAAALVGIGAGTAPSGAVPARPSAATTGCVGVDGAAVPSGGPNRATVVVDTGSGAVWSACISFSGSISGIEAISRAGEVIADLDPVFEQYAGLGKAVCRLRGVGTDPPDCLGKSASYWSYSHNGQVARVGAGAMTVKDGDVDGWRFGTGGTPRAATAGTKATSAPPTTTTTRPTTTTTRPSVTTTTRSGGGLTGRPGETTTTASPRPGETTTTVADGSSSSQATTTTAADGPGDEAGGGDGGATGGAGDDVDPGTAAGGEGDDSDQVASGAATSTVTEVDEGGGSAIGSIVGFGTAIGLVGLAGLVVRRRRALPPS